MFIAEGKGGHQRLVPVSAPVLRRGRRLPRRRAPGRRRHRPGVRGAEGPAPRAAAVGGTGWMRSSPAPAAGPGWRMRPAIELRHTCLTRLREAGMALEAVQAQAGHASIESTRIYLHLADDWLASQYRRGRRGHRRPGPRRPARRPPERPVTRRRAAAAGLGAARAGRSRQIAGHDAPLPGADRLRAAAGQRQRRRPGAALVRRRSWPRPHPQVTSLAQVTRRHIEDFKPWLAARPGQNKPRLTTATIAHRLGTLRMFFVRIDEWGWDEAPPRVPMFPGDLPRQDHPLPKALDDAAAAKLLRAAPDRPADAGPGHRRDAAAHRAAGQRVHRPARRRRGPDRRRALAARPGRQAPRGPLPARCTPSWSP